MMENLDTDKPKYIQIREIIRDEIEDGLYEPGSAIPSENDLAERFGTTRLTVRNAIDALVAGGLLRRVQGKGVYVMSERLGEADALELVGFRESVREKNAVPSVKALSKARRPAGGFFSHLFEIGENDDILAIKRVNYVDDVPLMMERTFIPISLFPKIESVDVGVFSLYQVYGMFGHTVASAVEHLDMVELGTRDAHLLGIEEGSAVISYECVSYDEDGIALEFASSYRRGDLGGYSVTY